MGAQRHKGNQTHYAGAWILTNIKQTNFKNSSHPITKSPMYVNDRGDDWQQIKTTLLNDVAEWSADSHNDPWIKLELHLQGLEPRNV